MRLMRRLRAHTYGPQKAPVDYEGFCFRLLRAPSDSVVADALVVAVPPVGTATGDSAAI
jgi:hypothetical protein